MSEGYYVAIRYDKPARFTRLNDRLCDNAHSDFKAGLHKHWIEMDGGLIYCTVCGRAWEDRHESD